MWLKTHSTVAHFLGLQWALEVTVRFRYASWGSGFQERCVRRCVETIKSSRSTLSFLEMWDPKQAAVFIICVLGTSHLGVTDVWYLSWCYRHLTSSSWFGCVVPKDCSIPHWIKRNLQNVLSVGFYFSVQMLFLIQLFLFWEESREASSTGMCFLKLFWNFFSLLWVSPKWRIPEGAGNQQAWQDRWHMRTLEWCSRSDAGWVDD